MTTFMTVSRTQYFRCDVYLRRIRNQPFDIKQSTRVIGTMYLMINLLQ